MLPERPTRKTTEGVFAGAKLPKSMRSRVGAIDPSGLDDVALQITRLLALHESLRFAFRTQDLRKLQMSEKRLLLADMYEALGITDEPTRAR